MFVVLFYGFAFKDSVAAQTQEELYSSAIQLMDDEFYDEAGEQFRKAIDSAPDSEIALFSQLKIVDIRLKQSDFEAAVQAALQAVDRKPKSFDAQFHLAGALAKVKRFEKSSHAFEKTVEIRPEEGLGLVGLGVAIFGAGEIDRAVKTIKKAKKLFKKQRNIPWHRNVRIMINQMNNFSKYPRNFSNLWLENNMKLIYETYEKSVFSTASSQK